MTNENRTMTVYLPNGERYFHTDSVASADETREEDHWAAQGYVVVFTESAAAQETGITGPDMPVPESGPASAADHSKEV